MNTNWPDRGYWAYNTLLGIFDAVVEGSITDIADEETAPGVFEGHALTPISTGNKAIYYGGPTMGWHKTHESSLPKGTEVLGRYEAVTGTPPAIVRMRGATRFLLFSCHLEAFEGVGVTELSTSQREANYMLRAEKIMAEVLAARP